MATESNPMPSIQLTDVEDELQRLLLDVAAYINPERPTDLRFTGGWVRDKLLGVDSHDIDVGISDMTGYQFGLKMKEYLDLPGKAERYDIRDVASDETSSSSDTRHVVRGLHKIEANPEKSKHLETVTTKIFGLDIDLVNLRKETYAEDSRNPQMEYGTPEEDALRRDATMNAMFYNLRTRTVEDLTQRGWNDMQHKLIRTPLDPYQTFKDDPLRILRLIRFASRLGYKLDPAAEKSMQDPTIRDALEAKISRERVGVELEKMLRGPDPHLALSFIHRLGLYNTIFTDPGKRQPHEFDLERWPRAYDAARIVIDEASTITDVLFSHADDQAYIIWTLSSLVPWADAPIAQFQPNKKPLPAPGVGVARNGIKAPNKLADIVQCALANANEIIETKNDFLKHSRDQDNKMQNGSPGGRDTLGMLLRKWGPTWTSQMTFALMLEATRTERPLEDLLRDYGKLLQHIRAIGIEDAASFKSIIDGKALAQALETKPGVWMKSALDEVMAWQLAHPDNNDPQEVIDMIREKRGELTDRLMSHFLALTIRPLFAQTKTQNEMGVTQQGHRVLGKIIPPRSTGSIETFQEAEAKRPWKQEKEAYALDLLKWCISTLKYDMKRTSRNWPLLVPPLLGLVDDIDLHFKVIGCKLLKDLMVGTDSHLLKRTGLGEVFEKAITPCLSYLPTLTPENESVMMLDAAYPAMMWILIRHRREMRGEEEDEFYYGPAESQVVYLLHKHLLPAFFHAPHDNYPTLAVCLLKQLDRFMVALKLNTTAQLMHIVPVLTSILSTPFAEAAPAMIYQAAKTLQVLIDCSWPRVWRWRGDLLSGVCKAWLALYDGFEDRVGNEDKQLWEAKEQLKVAVQMLARHLKACNSDSQLDVTDEDLPQPRTKIDVAGEFRQLCTAEPRLQGLLDLDAPKITSVTNEALNSGCCDR